MIVTLALIGKLVIGAAYALVYLYATEVFPTLLRTYGLGTSSMVGRVGSVTAPFIVDLMVSGRRSIELSSNYDKTYKVCIFISGEGEQYVSNNCFRCRRYLCGYVGSSASRNEEQEASGDN